jgi:electron transport complex protein RnfE
MDRKENAFLPNPVIGSLIGLCPIVVVSGNFASGVMVALGILLSMLALGALLPAIRGLFPERLRAPLAFALAAVFSAAYGLAAEAYSPLLSTLTGIFIPLTVVNCLILTTLRRGIRDTESIAAWVLPTAFLYFLTVVLLSAFREALGSGRLTLPTPGELPMTLAIFDTAPLRILTSPAGGFILLGCFAAIYRMILRKQGRRIP